MITGAELRLAASHRRHQPPHEVRPGHMGTVAEDVDLRRRPHGRHPGKTVVVLLSAAVGLPGHHMPQGGIAGLQALDQPHRGIRLRGGHHHGQQARIVLLQQGLQRLFHAGVLPGGGDDERGGRPVILMGKAEDGRLFLAGQPFAHLSQPDQKAALQDGQQQKDLPHIYSLRTRQPSAGTGAQSSVTGTSGVRRASMANERPLFSRRVPLA